MRRKNLANQKVIRAITMGIVAYMALQSPMSVLAAESDGTTPDPAPSAGESAASALVDIEGGVADASQTLAEEAATLIGVNDPTTTEGDTNASAACEAVVADILTDLDKPETPAAPATGSSETTPAAPASGSSETTPAAPATGSSETAPASGENANTTNGEEASTAKMTDKAATDAALVAAAKNLETVTVQPAPGEATAAKEDNLVNAAADVEKVKQDLIELEHAAADSNTAAVEVTDNFVAASDVANSAESEASGAVEKADQYIAIIKNTSSTTAASQAKAELDQLLIDLATNLGLKQQAFNTFKDQYEQAKTDLDAAETRFKDSLRGATADVTAANNELKQASTKANTLKNNVEAAIKDIDTLNGAAVEIMNKMDAVNKTKDPDWNKQRDLFFAVLKNYSDIIEPGATVTGIENFNKDAATVEGEGGKYHYFKVTYTVGDETKVKYYNYDRDDKSGNDTNLNGNSRNIVIYEKTAEEIGAVEYLKTYLANANVKYNASKHTVYTYKDAEGNTRYIVKEELEKNPSVTSAEVQEVVQNRNSKYVDPDGGHYFAVSDATLNKLVDDARTLRNQYVEYQTQAKAAHKAVNDAKTKVNKLQEAIKDLGTVDKKGNVTSTAAGRLTLGGALEELLGEKYSEESCAKYLGFTTETVMIDGEETSIAISDMDLTLESLLNMPVRDALTILDGLLDKEQDKLDAAKGKLEDLQMKQEQAGQELEKTLERLKTNPSDDGGDIIPGESGGDDGGAGIGGETGSYTFSTPAGPGAAGTTTAVAGGNGGNGGNGRNGTNVSRNGVLGARNNGDGGEELTNIGDGKTALAGNLKEITGDKTSDTNKKEKMTIQDPETPLDSFDSVGTNDKNWMWWVLAVLTGAVTYEEYKRRQRRKAKALQVSETEASSTDSKPEE